MHAAPAGAPGEAPDRRRWWTLGVLTLSLVIVVMGNSALNVALPTLVTELDATDTQLQWIVDAYALVFGGTLLFMGALGDRFGRGGALRIGLAVFGVASAGAAFFASSATHLIVARAVMGLAAALVMPATLSILTTVFRREERGRAIGVWASFAGFGSVFGLMASGYVLEHYAWRGVFLLNVPVVLVALGAGFALVPTSRDPRRVPLDYVGGLLSIIALGAGLVAIIEGPALGWRHAAPATAVVVALAAGAAFVAWERRTAHPLLPLAFFRDRALTLAVVAIAATFFALFATFYVGTQLTQFVLGYSPLVAGLAFLPLGVTMLVGAPHSHRVVQKVGARDTIAIGLVLVATALVLLAFVARGTPYHYLGAAFLVLGIGMSLTMAPATAVVMKRVPPAKAGVGSSLNDTAREVGGAFGIAVVGSLVKAGVAATFAAALWPALGADARARAATGLGNALGVAQDLGGPEGAAVAAAARDAFVAAVAPALALAAALAALAAGAMLTWFPQNADGEAPPAPAPVAAPQHD